MLYFDLISTSETLEEIFMIHTLRLLIRQFTEQDYQSLFEYLSNPSIYICEPGEPITLEAAREIAKKRSQNNDFWAVILNNTGELVGHIFLSKRNPPNSSHGSLDISLTLSSKIKGMPQNLPMH
jgi:RimJ/RimL family protein N-acetyltransferase